MSRLHVSKLSSTAANKWSIDVGSNSFLNFSGSIINTVYKRTDVQASYSSTTSGNGTTISDLNITITPKSATSLLLCTWMINAEVHWNNVFVIHKNGSLITTSGYEGYNNAIGNLRYSGIASAFYDNDNATTPSNYYIQYVVPSISTVESTYAPAIRSSEATAYTFFLNRTISSAGADNNENMVSTGMIQEIAQ
jgi:hypothetical protein